MFLNYAEARKAAQRVLPRGLFEYIDRGAEDETLLRHNRQTLDAVRFVPRVLRQARTLSLETCLMGKIRPTPLVVAPTALAGLVCHDGEVELAKACADVSIPFCVSTQSSSAIERIAGASSAELWFQLYVWRDRQLTDDLLARVADAGVEVLVVTVDTPVAPKKEYNTRNGFAIPWRPSITSVLDGIMHPSWVMRVLLPELIANGVPTYAHYPKQYRMAVGQMSGGPVALAEDLAWSDIERLRHNWKGRLLLKGVLDPGDAAIATRIGVDGIIVSNHGARQCDVASSPLETLPAIARGSGGDLAILADSGVQRGSDVLRYLANGAQSVMVGRAPLFALAVGGRAGAARMLQMLMDEMVGTLIMLGASSPGDAAMMMALDHRGEKL